MACLTRSEHVTSGPASRENQLRVKRIPAPVKRRRAGDSHLRHRPLGARGRSGKAARGLAGTPGGTPGTPLGSGLAWSPRQAAGRRALLLARPDAAGWSCPSRLPGSRKARQHDPESRTGAPSSARGEGAACAAPSRNRVLRARSPSAGLPLARRGPRRAPPFRLSAASGPSRGRGRRTPRAGRMPGRFHDSGNGHAALIHTPGSPKALPNYLRPSAYGTPTCKYVRGISIDDGAACGDSSPRGRPTA